jgi:hypothetical protein
VSGWHATDSIWRYRIAPHGPQLATVEPDGEGWLWWTESGAEVARRQRARRERGES